MTSQRNVLLMTTPVSHVRMSGITQFAKERGWHLMIADRLSRLPESQQKLLTLRVIQGLSYEEISKITGLSPLNIRVQVSLARKKLKP